jgi:hypothetical protein
MYEICKTELYDDCLVGNLDTFVQDISSNPHKVDLLGRVKTLRLYEADTSLLKEPTYLQLVSNEEWPYLVAKKNANDFYRPLQLAKQQEGFADRFLYGPAVLGLKIATIKSPALSQLQRITMSAEEISPIWGSSQSEFTSFAKRLEPAPVPLLLVGLPSVQHYCQRLPTGPLALPNHLIKIDNPPGMVTIHTAKMLSKHGLIWLPPIILGTTNRFMFRCEDDVLCSIHAEEDMIAARVAQVLHRLQVMLGERPVLRVYNDTNHEYLPFSSVSLDDTRIEIYDYIRCFKFDDVMNPFPKSTDRPMDLAPIESMFNERIGRWKGKVFLKSRDECPPCSACGFEGEWKISNGGSGDGTFHFVE